MIRLAIILLTLGIVTIPISSRCETVRVNADSVVSYLLTCRKANGAFGPLDQEYTDAAWNYPAVAALRVLNHPIGDSAKIVAHGLGYPEGHVGYGHWQFFHFHLTRQLLGNSFQAGHTIVVLKHQGYTPRYYGSPFGTDGKTFFQSGSASEGDPRDKEARQLGYYNLSSLYYLVAGLKASGRSFANREAVIAFIRRCQAPQGGFVDLRSEAGQPTDEESHVAHTFHAIATLKIVGKKIPNVSRHENFLRSCQIDSGGFRWNPRSDLSGNTPDVYYAWAAIRALALLDKEARAKASTIRWLNSLHNADGGFGDRPNWRSRIYSTYYAVDALSALAGNARNGISDKQITRKTTGTIPDGTYQIFQGLFKVPVLAESDLAGLKKRGFNLLAIKASDFSTVPPLRHAIGRQDIAMDVILCPEAYPHRTRGLGGLLLDHVANVTLDPRWNNDQRRQWAEADAVGAIGLDWQSYQRRVIRTARQLESLIYPEQDFEMEHAYRAYDSDTAEHPGYNAVLAGFNWVPRDFVRVFPWRERYVDKLTPIADADAHGDLKKWSPQLDHVRHLYIAKEPTYAGFQKAAAEGRVVCVINSPEGVASGVSYYGTPEAVDYVKRHLAAWKWWQ